MKKVEDQFRSVTLPNLRILHSTAHLTKVGVPKAHLTDLYKKRRPSGALRAGLPDDFHVHVSLFRFNGLVQPQIALFVAAAR
jgi:hypothetical protein